MTSFPIVFAVFTSNRPSYGIFQNDRKTMKAGGLQWECANGKLTYIGVMLNNSVCLTTGTPESRNSYKKKTQLKIQLRHFLANINFVQKMLKLYVSFLCFQLFFWLLNSWIGNRDLTVLFSTITSALHTQNNNKMCANDQQIQTMTLTIQLFSNLLLHK